jgi:hypothetical protein
MRWLALLENKIMYYKKIICYEKLEDLIFFFVFGCIDLC